jgi:hypothetical protein
VGVERHLTNALSAHKLQFNRVSGKNGLQNKSHALFAL